MKYNHVLQPIYVIYKARAVGFSSLGNNAFVKYMKQCKYCSYSCSELVVQYNIPSCISDDEKIIKDLLE